jgi:exopolyphosphatase/guanosine-5'-triphosphate,3'-diphosphate pyrophosphatase
LDTKPEIKRELNSVIDGLSDAATVGLSTDSYYAAVDLGSNSFHMMISRYQHGEFTVIDRQKEVVRLAGGLDESGFLSDEVRKRALECLSRFGQQLKTIPTSQVRVVGTNALRRMHSKAVFLNEAERALGHNIEIIAGREEARLSYLGVSRWSVPDESSRLVIDIGGGSTEIIVGRGDTPLARESLELGCVVQSNLFFSDGVLNLARIEQATLSAKLAIQPVIKQFRVEGWSQVIGCSGTMKSLANILIDGGWSKDGSNRSALEHLVKLVVTAGHIDNLRLSGLTGDRLPVFAGGLTILLALFEAFDIQDMAVSEIALREGVLYDLVGRSSNKDIRDITVTAMLRRWAVETNHGERVCETALSLFDQVAGVWDVQLDLYRNILRWSAQLHELGLLISHDGYHKHGAYVVGNADMAGFTRRDQLLLAALVVGQRRKFPVDQFEQLPSNLVTPAKRIAIILRLSVLMHRARSSRAIELESFNASGQQVSLTFASGFLDSNPLTRADLAQEQAWLKAMGVKLSFS